MSNSPFVPPWQTPPGSSGPFPAFPTPQSPVSLPGPQKALQQPPSVPWVPRRTTAMASINLPAEMRRKAKVRPEQPYLAKSFGPVVVLFASAEVPPEIDQSPRTLDLWALKTISEGVTPEAARDVQVPGMKDRGSYEAGMARDPHDYDTAKELFGETALVEVTDFGRSWPINMNSRGALQLPPEVLKMFGKITAGTVITANFAYLPDGGPAIYIRTIVEPRERQEVMEANERQAFLTNKIEIFKQHRAEFDERVKELLEREAAVAKREAAVTQREEAVERNAQALLVATNETRMKLATGKEVDRPLAAPQYPTPNWGRPLPPMNDKGETIDSVTPTETPATTSPQQQPVFPGWPKPTIVTTSQPSEDDGEPGDEPTNITFPDP